MENVYKYQMEIKRLNKELVRAVDWDLSSKIINEIQDEIVKYEKKIEEFQNSKQI